MKITVGTYGTHEILAIEPQASKKGGIAYFAVFYCDGCNKRSLGTMSRVGKLIRRGVKQWLCSHCDVNGNLIQTLRTQTPKQLRPGVYAGTRRAYFATVVCQDCQHDFEGSIPALRQLESSGDQKLRCRKCHDDKARRDKRLRAEKSKLKAKGAPRCSVSDKTLAKTGKLPLTTIKALNALCREGRRIADKIIRHHVSACKKLGVKIEQFDRVVIEAIEEAQRELRHGAPTVIASWLKPEPFRRYEQYATPKEV
jgi:hypothetical protein